MSIECGICGEEFEGCIWTDGDEGCPYCGATWENEESWDGEEETNYTIWHEKRANEPTNKENEGG